MKKKILAISGSTKANSTNETLLKMMGEMAKDKCDMSIYPIGSLPFFTDRNGGSGHYLHTRICIQSAGSTQKRFGVDGVLIQFFGKENRIDSSISKWREGF